MTEDLKDILTEVLKSPEAAQDAADLITSNRGQEILPDLIWNLTTRRFNPVETETVWQGIVAHNQDLANQLGRNPGLRVAALDYFSNVLGQDAHPQSAHPELIEHLFQQATNDALTGLANRRYFKARFRDELNRAHRYSTPFTLLLFDVDDFKAVNDTHGHSEGDRILVGVADAIRECIRDSDVGARWGGEEFSVLMPEAARAGGGLVAERVRASVEDRFTTEGVTLSGGLASFPEHGADEDSLFQFADRALYRAKAEGKNRISAEPRERREGMRNERQIPLTVEREGDRPCALETETVNTSEGGLAFRHGRVVRIAEEIVGKVHVGTETASFRGRVTHVDRITDDQYDIGVAFTEVDPATRRMLAGES